MKKRRLSPPPLYLTGLTNHSLEKKWIKLCAMSCLLYRIALHSHALRRASCSECASHACRSRTTVDAALSACMHNS